MQTKIHPAWRQFRALQGIMQFGAALTLAIVMMVLSPQSARADAIAHQGADWVRLTLAACADPAVVAALEAQGQHADAFRAAAAHIGGADYSACWRPVAGGAGLVFSDGDAGYVPADSLKPAPEA